MNTTSKCDIYITKTITIQSVGETVTVRKRDISVNGFAETKVGNFDRTLRVL